MRVRCELFEFQELELLEHISSAAPSGFMIAFSPLEGQWHHLHLRSPSLTAQCPLNLLGHEPIRSL